MECAVAIQVLPLDSASDEETCRVVDEVIAAIERAGFDPYVGPFESTIEGDYDACMDVLRECQLAAVRAGCGHVMTYAKIDYKPAGGVMTTEHKVGKYHEDEFGDERDASVESAA